MAAAPQSGVLIVALSGRALAQAVRRAGFAPYVLDLFRDRDTRALAAESRRLKGSLASGFDRDHLLESVQAMDAAAGERLPLVLGSGLEDEPGLVGALAEGRSLLGNAPGVLARLLDPPGVASLFEACGLQHPETRLRPAGAARGWPDQWLVKRAGASGGAHVRAARKSDKVVPGRYFQRRAPGSPLSLLFLADGREALPLFYSEQWPAALPGGPPYLFGGAAGPVLPPAALRGAVAEGLRELVARLGLVGLNSLDLLAEEESFQVLEVNPRPGATLDLFDGDEGPGLFALHREACAGRLPEAWPQADSFAPPGARALQVLYAARDLTLPAEEDWLAAEAPDATVDLPESGARLAAGAPICTLIAGGADAAEARTRLAARASALEEQLENRPDRRRDRHAG